MHGFTKVFAWVLEQANIPLEITQVHAHERRDIHFYISYRGPLGGLGMHKRLKVDITRGEQLEFVPVRKNVFCSYADLAGFSLLCYPLEEVLIEKMCALLGRTEPRDLYDLWYLLEIEGLPATHPLQGATLRALRQLQRLYPDPPYLFCSERQTPLSPRTAHWIIAQAGQAAGLPFPIHPHMLRHSTGFYLANKGVDTRAIQAYMGHARIENTVIYTALDANRFNGFWNG